MRRKLTNMNGVVGYRYVLILERGGRDQVVRHSSFRPLREGETVPTARYGSWVVRRLVQSDDPTFRDGLAHCEPAEADRT